VCHGHEHPTVPACRTASPTVTAAELLAKEVGEAIDAIAAFISSSAHQTVGVGVPTYLLRGDVYYWGSLTAACRSRASRAGSCTTCSSIGSSRDSVEAVK
jgi:hypothetical protein